MWFPFEEFIMLYLNESGSENNSGLPSIKSIELDCATELGEVHCVLQKNRSQPLLHSTRLTASCFNEVLPLVFCGGGAYYIDIQFNFAAYTGHFEVGRYVHLL